MAKGAFEIELYSVEALRAALGDGLRPARS
jgi:hypothetical protein